MTAAMPRRPGTGPRDGGFSLIEMLIALLVISVGLLGMAGLQAYSLRNNVSAYHRTLADDLAYQVFDAMRANRPAALSGDYEFALTDTVPTSASTRAETDLVHWFYRRPANQSGPTGLFDRYLPGGMGAIDCTTNAPNCVVIVQWNDTRGQGLGATQQLSVSTRL